jgi:cell wall-associated NlpC family hydrolase
MASRHGVAAAKAVTQDGFTGTVRECQKFVRQVYESTDGLLYEPFRATTAEGARVAWSGSRFAVAPGRGSVPGDILYKRGTSKDRAGHVGIRVAGNRVAENSSTKIGRVSGAKGFRTLEQFGKIDLIVRLP